MIRCAKVRWTKFDLYYGWRFVLRTPEEFGEYWKAVRPNQIRTAFQAFADKIKTGTSHAVADPLGYVWETQMEAHQKHLFTAIVDVDGKVVESMLEIIRKTSAIYVAPNGAYFGHMADLAVTDERELDKWILPANNVISVQQWPNGKHWYATVDGERVTQGSLDKWTSKTTAEWAAKDFIKRGVRKK